MIRFLLPLALAVLAPGHASASPLEVQVTDASGAPLANAVITLPAPDGFDPERHRFQWPMMMEQQRLQFVPHVLVVPRGAQVEFPNRDRVRHHVYSFSGSNAFELELYGREEARLVGFGHPGAVVLGCNIHDAMIGYIRVVETPYAAMTGADGVAAIADAPEGPLTVTVWHPYATSADGTATLALAEGDSAGRTAQISLNIRAPR
ncbi:MAG: Copper binding protein, plastocyanin/azurin family [Oceanicaulis sp. HLUCCA04]|nr:MAG: Copper binding protein, plastocyanin/azurin family [Oceanicaulis sp. HLUCCA04]